MKLLADLTRMLCNGIEVYPGTPLPQLKRATTVENDGYAETAMTFYSHVGTHMDAPAHMLSGGKTLDEYPPERFFGSGIVINFSAFKENEIIGRERLTIRERELIIHKDFLLFDTGYDSNLNALGTYPVPSEELLRFAIQNGVKAVGIDRMSIDPLGATQMQLHRLLFEDDVLIIENLKGLSQLTDKEFSVCALPLLYCNADGAPVRVVAIEQ